MNITEQTTRTLKTYTIAKHTAGTVHYKGPAAGFTIWSQYRDDKPRDLTIEFTGADLPMLRQIVEHLELTVGKV